MQAIQASSRGFRLLMHLNFDRFIYVFTIVFSLAAGAFIGSL